MPEFAPLLLSPSAYIFAGFVVGLAVGRTGVGGGSLMTPLLIFGFGIKPHLAIGTDLLFAAVTKLAGTGSLARHRLIDWRVVGQVALGSVPACLVALYVLQQLGPASPATQTILTTALVASGQAAGWITARYLAGHCAHEKNPGPDHPLALVRLAGLRRTQIDCHLI